MKIINFIIESPPENFKFKLELYFQTDIFYMPNWNGAGVLYKLNQK